MSRPKTCEPFVQFGRVLALLLPLLAGCALAPTTARIASRPAAARNERLDAPGIAWHAARMEACLASLRNLRRDRPAQQPDYLLPGEYDRVEVLLSEYLACRAKLQQTALEQASPPNSEGLGQLALARQAECDIALATAALDDAVLRQDLNQEFHRSGIPEGTCDQIMHEVTDSNFVRSLPEVSTERGVVPASHQEDQPAVPDNADTRRKIEEVIRRRSLVLPAMENEMWHLPPTRFLARAGRATAGHFHRARGSLVARLGRLQNPASRPLEFTPDQRRDIRAALQPGDVLLSYSEGFASNLVIPGAFKHAVTFVGTPDDRLRAGIPAEALISQAGPSNQRLPLVLQQTKVSSGEPADVVESIAEGVLLDNFDRILTTRVNRLVVLRPRLTPEERAAQLVDVLSLVGDEYDFSFDLTDGSDQVCTELIYRSLHGRGGIAFPLTKHAGSLTLTADEILKYHLEAGAGQFECVLVVDEDPRAPGKATIYFAGEGHAWLSRLPELRSPAAASLVSQHHDGVSRR